MSGHLSGHGNGGAGDGGFTLVEILLGLAIVSLSIVALQPVMRPATPEHVLEASARLLTATLRSARLAAIRGNREVVVSINVRERAYVGDGASPRRLLPAGIDVAATAPTKSTSASRVHFRFFPDGSASGGNIRLSWRANSYLLVVDWLSGHVGTTHGVTP